LPASPKGLETTHLDEKTAADPVPTPTRFRGSIVVAPDRANGDSAPASKLQRQTRSAAGLTTDGAPFD